MKADTTIHSINCIRIDFNNILETEFKFILFSQN